MLSSGQGSRLVLADSDKLRDKLDVMSQRIRQLEDALQIEYTHRSTGTHPLLAEDLLMIKAGFDVPENREVRSDSLTEEELSHHVGVLALSENNTVRWLGTSGSVVCLSYIRMIQDFNVMRSKRFSW